MAIGASNCAFVAAPPSPLKPDVPVPANVVMMPFCETLRIRAFWESAMYRLPATS
jgi:hypothetical protein